MHSGQEHPGACSEVIGESEATVARTTIGTRDTYVAEIVRSEETKAPWGNVIYTQKLRVHEIHKMAVSASPIQLAMDT